MFAYHLWRDMVLGIFINILEEDASVFFNELMETKLTEMKVSFKVTPYRSECKVFTWTLGVETIRYQNG